MTPEPNQGSRPPAQRARARDLGIRIGSLPTGPTNTLVDVTGVSVGHRTVWRDEPDPPAGRGTARTGITVIVPLGLKEIARYLVPAGSAVLNGAGEVIGITSIGEWGMIETPIFLTSSMAIGRVYDGAVAVLSEEAGDQVAAVDRDAIMPVVAECDDGDLNRSVPVQVDEADVRAALDAASEPGRGAFALGVVGSGTGMSAFGFKAGIGSASRLVRPTHRWADAPPPDAPTFTVGALVMANFGEIGRLTVDGVRVGESLKAEGWPDARGAKRAAAHAREGSCIVVVATDAPLFTHQLDRLARRIGLGLARTGSTAHHGSGEIFLAFSTGIRVDRTDRDPVRTTAHVDDEHLDPFFAAVVEATEEATLDALFTADTVTGQAGHTALGLPVERTLELLRAGGRLVAAR